MKEEIIRDIIIDQNNYPKKEFIEREQDYLRKGGKFILSLSKIRSYWFDK